MVFKEVTLPMEGGIHFRVYNGIIKILKKTDCRVYVEKDGNKATFDSISNILRLNLAKGDTIRVIVEGLNENITLAKLIYFIENYRCSRDYYGT